MNHANPSAVPRRLTEAGALSRMVFQRSVGSRWGWMGEMAREVLGPQLHRQLQEDPSQIRSAVWSLVFAMFALRIQLLFGVLVTAIVGPSLISRDIRTRAFLIYFARPISPLDYVMGKSGILLGMLATVSLIPSLVLYVLSILFSPSVDIGRLAHEHARQSNPRSMAGLLIKRLASLRDQIEADLLSFLLFDGEFASRLAQLGHNDAVRRSDEILSFFGE